jgi:hypothetical protein
MIGIRTIRLALGIMAVGMSLCAAGQDSTSAPTPDSSQGQPAPPTPQSTAPAPAFGQNAPVLNPDNPPVSGLDVPSLDLRIASRSFIAPALQVSESADTNGGNDLGNPNGLQGITRVLGALDVQKFWTKSDLFLEYLGGGAFYSSPFDAKQLQAVGMEAVTRWRTGQVSLRDAFSYLPDGSFQIGFGGDPGLGLANVGFGAGMPGGGLAGLNTPNLQLGSVGNIPRLANTAIVDAVQALNPRSAITLAGGFSNAHFYDPSGTLINSDQVTLEGGYTHLLSRRDQIGFIYAFQLFQFPQSTGGEVYIHVVNLRYSHTISGRLSFVAGAGPQYIDLEDGGPTTHLSLSARVQLRYRMGHGSLIASYEKYTSAGSGFFAGANTQGARLGYTRPLGRRWELYSDLDYSHNTKLQNADFGATNSSSYDDGSAGIVLRKHLGRTYDFFASYRFSELSFNTVGGALVCLDGADSCGRVAQRHVGTIGIEWHPKPTRID